MTKPLPDGCIHVVIEIPRGSRNKYEIDHDTNRVYLDRRLFTATTYPADYGFIPDTLGGDGDPLDALVLLDDPVYPGVWVQARPVGVLYMLDEAGEDAKIICVPPERAALGRRRRHRRPAAAARRPRSATSSRCTRRSSRASTRRPRASAGATTAVASEIARRPRGRTSRRATGHGPDGVIRAAVAVDSGPVDDLRAPYSAAPIAPARSPSSAKRISGCARRFGRVHRPPPCARAAPARTRRRAIDTPAADDEPRRVERVGEVGQPGGHPRGEVVEHGDGVGVARRPRPPSPAPT